MSIFSFFKKADTEAKVEEETVYINTETDTLTEEEIKEMFEENKAEGDA